jgi:hypothetical protein
LEARDRRYGYMLVEALVYIGVLFVLLGSATPIYRCALITRPLRRTAWTSAVPRAANAGGPTCGRAGNIRLKAVARTSLPAAGPGQVQYRFGEAQFAAHRRRTMDARAG